MGILFWLWKWLLASLKWAPELSLDTTSICAHHIVQPFSSLYNVGSVTLPEENGSEELPHSTIGPMLTEHISWVDGPFNMVESNKTGCHCFANAMDDRAVCLLCSLACILVALLTTASLSPNNWLWVRTGTPRYRRVLRKSMICSTQVRAAMNSEP